MERLMARAARRDRGFTLTEVMLALTLLSIGVLSLAAIHLMTLDFGNRGRHATRASAIAQDRIERLERVRWTDASIQPTAGWSGPTTEKAEVQVGGVAVEQSYDVFVRVTNAVAGVSRNVDVRVDWTEQGGHSRSYALSTIRYNLEGL
jgi:prepilin-type N-terminal cleavage/methylation domain-containing protein